MLQQAMNKEALHTKLQEEQTSFEEGQRAKSSPGSSCKGREKAHHAAMRTNNFMHLYQIPYL